MSTKVKTEVQFREKDSNPHGYVGARISKKQQKLYLASTPKHGAVSRQLSKFYMGMIKNPPGPAIQPNSKKKDKK